MTVRIAYMTGEYPRATDVFIQREVAELRRQGFHVETFSVRQPAAAEQAMRYQNRRDVLCDGLKPAGWEVEPPKATMFVWAKIPAPYDRMGSLKFAFELMDKALVAAAPGSGFGEAGEGYLRLALVENEKRLQQAVRQIRRAFPVKEKA